MIKLVNHVRASAGLCAVLASPAAVAEVTAALDYTDPNSDRSAPRVLRYNTENSAPERADPTRSPEVATAASAAEAGYLSPYTLPARVVSGRSWARAVGGYDTGASTYRVRSSAEASMTNYLALRVDFEHGPSTSSNDRAGLGARLQVLNQKAHGLDVGVGLSFQPSDFRGEGNLVGGFMLGRRFNRVAIFGSALLGSDPEGDDQELDGRLSTLVRVHPAVHLGWDNRFRAVLTNDTKRFGTTTVDWELAMLPSVVLTFGPIAFIGEAGFSALQQTHSVGRPEQHRTVHKGLLAMAGAGMAI